LAIFIIASCVCGGSISAEFAGSEMGGVLFVSEICLTWVVYAVSDAIGLLILSDLLFVS